MVAQACRWPSSATRPLRTAAANNASSPSACSSTPAVTHRPSFQAAFVQGIGLATAGVVARSAITCNGVALATQTLQPAGYRSCSWPALGVAWDTDGQRPSGAGQGGAPGRER